MTQLAKGELSVFYFKVTDIWKKLCEEHSELLNLTMEEYGHLLHSDLDALEQKIEQKREVIGTIKNLEVLRREAIEEINSVLTNREISNYRDLLNLMDSFELEKNSGHLRRFNSLLIDIIEKIQVQNKRNQIFINKAVHSLRSLREEASGEKSYQTYGKNGVTRSRSLPVESR